MDLEPTDIVGSTFESFPHIAEEIFGHLDKKTLKNCYKVSKSWRNFLLKQTFFLTKLTHGLNGWKAILIENNFEDISTLVDSLIKMEAEERTFNIHPIFCAIYSQNLDLVKRLACFFPRFQKLKIQTRAPRLKKLKIQTAGAKSKLFLSPLYYAAYKKVWTLNPYDDYWLVGSCRIVTNLLEIIEEDKNPGVCNRKAIEEARRKLLSWVLEISKETREKQRQWLDSIRRRPHWR